VVELLQTELNQSAAHNGEQSNYLSEIKQALSEQHQGFETLRGQARYLEQYRIDSIFRVFSLKGQAKIALSEAGLLKFR
jgi:hypothetical protein